MYFSGKGSGGSGGKKAGGGASASARSDVLDAARRERENRALERGSASFAVKIQRVARGFVTRGRFVRERVSELTSKLADLSRLTAVLASKGMKFVPPVTALSQLLTPMLACSAGWHERNGQLSSADAAVIAGILALLLQSLRAPTGVLSDLANDLHVYALPLSGKGWGSAASQIACLHSASLLATLVNRSLRLAAEMILYCELPAATRNICVELLWFCVSFDPTSLENKATPAQLGNIKLSFARTIAGKIAFASHIVRPLLLSLPMDSGCSYLLAPETELALCSRAFDVSLTSLATALSCADDNMHKSVCLEAAVFVYTPFLMARVPVATTITSNNGVLALGMQSVCSGAVCPPADWLQGPRRRLRAKGSPRASTKSAKIVSSLMSQWSPRTYIAANCCQLLASTSPASNKVLAAFLGREVLTSILQYISETIEPMVEELLSSSTPIRWLKDGVECPPNTLGATVVPMPQLMVLQFRSLSHERLAKALAKTCLDMNAACLKHPRLVLDDSVDEEKTTYQAYAVDVSAAGAGASSLMDAPGIGTSIVRSIWQGSKLAMSLFSRKKPSAATEVVSKPPSLPVSPQKAATVDSHSASAASRTGLHVSFDLKACYQFARLYAMLLCPNIRPSAHAIRSDAEPIVGRRYLLNALAFTPSLSLIRRLWWCLVETTEFKDLVSGAFKATVKPYGAIAILSLFSMLLLHFMAVVDDFELYQQNQPLPLRELRHVIRLLRDMLAHADGIGADKFDTDIVGKCAAPATSFWPRFAATASGLLRALYDRHSQRPLGPADMWLVNVSKVSLVIPPSVAHKDEVLYANNRLLASMPFAVPFDTRASMYWRMRDEARNACQYGLPQVPVTVQRARLFETAYSALENVKGDKLKRKVYVTFVNSEGYNEAGIDAGGLFKELWTSLSNLVFDPSYGLFKVTDQGEMYPNPESSLCTGVEDDVAFEFIGRVLGKALFEGITIGPQFARFFLHKLLGRSVNLHHLPSLDPELYKSLMFLKTYEGDVADLCLTFTVSHDLGSGSTETELVPGGASIAVTGKNRMQYIHLIADWRLNQSIERQSSAFLRGLRDVIPQSWLSTFSAPELQVIISGAARGIDLDDLEKHTSYSAGFFSMHPTVLMFWKVMSELSVKDRAALLKFVTSCERPPPNGFRQLEPAFNIVPLSGAQANSLPMASTCFNTLKLPSYSDKATMKAKILIAIHSGAGFEMS